MLYIPIRDGSSNRNMINRNESYVLLSEDGGYELYKKPDLDSGIDYNKEFSVLGRKLVDSHIAMAYNTGNGEMHSILMRRKGLYISNDIVLIWGRISDDIIKISFWVDNRLLIKDIKMAVVLGEWIPLSNIYPIILQSKDTYFPAILTDMKLNKWSTHKVVADGRQRNIKCTHNEVLRHCI